MKPSWQESYKAALLEIDSTKLEGRVQAAESEIQERQRVLSDDHGEAAEEKQALADALNSLRVLRMDAASWLEQQKSANPPNSTLEH